MPIVDNVYSGLYYKHYSMINGTIGSDDEDTQALQKFLDDITKDNASDSVVAITMLPRIFFPSKSEGIASVKNVVRGFPILNYVYDPVLNDNGTNWYMPKNKKMYTSPYMFIEMDGIDSKTQYKIEKFPSELLTNTASKGYLGTVNFSGMAGISPVPDIVITPVSKYNGVNGKESPFVVSGFPQLPYVIDSYRAYIASKGGEFGYALTSALTVTSSVLNGIRGTDKNIVSMNNEGQLSGMGTQQTMGALSNIANFATKEYAETHKGDMARGNSNYSIGMYAGRIKNIYIRQIVINLEDFKKIDDFFSVYGYAVNQLEVPTFNSRPVWNYIKTKQCNVTGEMPNEAIDKIKSIFNNGITWWKNINTMLDYSQNNSPTGN